MASLTITCEQHVLEVPCRDPPCSIGAGTLLRGDFSHCPSLTCPRGILLHILLRRGGCTRAVKTHLLTRKETQEDVGRGYIRGEGTRTQAGKKTFFHSMPLYVKLSHVQSEI